MYIYFRDRYESELMYSCQRFSNNSKPEFTHQEIMTIYLYAMHTEQRFKVKQIYQYASDHLRSWFPLLTSYEVLNMRLNRLGEVFKILSANVIDKFLPSDCVQYKSLLDSMPVITCLGKREEKVANEITDKGFCSTKGMYYSELKLHALAFYRSNHMPFPEQFQLTTASENDLNIFKQAWGGIENRTFFGNKIYHDAEYFQQTENKRNSLMLIPVKAIKDQDEFLRQRDKVANELFSTAVSRIRQPIDSLFNWLIEKQTFKEPLKYSQLKDL